MQVGSIARELVVPSASRHGGDLSMSLELCFNVLLSLLWLGSVALLLRRLGEPTDGA